MGLSTSKKPIQKTMSDSFPRFRALRGQREVCTLRHERPIMMHGQQTTEIRTFRVVIEPDQPYTPTSKVELAALRNSRFKGKVYEEIPSAQEVQQAQEKASSDPVTEMLDDAEQAEELTKPEEQAETTALVIDEVSGKVEAAQVLSGEPYNVDVQALKSDAGNFTKKKIRKAADANGLEFPNL